MAFRAAIVLAPPPPAHAKTRMNAGMSGGVSGETRPEPDLLLERTGFELPRPLAVVLANFDYCTDSGVGESSRNDRQTETHCHVKAWLERQPDHRRANRGSLLRPSKGRPFIV
jgi:hypothetical protein